MQKRLTMPRSYQCVLEVGCLEVAAPELWGVLEVASGDKRARALQVGRGSSGRGGTAGAGCAAAIASGLPACVLSAVLLGLC